MSNFKVFPVCRKQCSGLRDMFYIVAPSARIASSFVYRCCVAAGLDNAGGLTRFFTLSDFGFNPADDHGQRMIADHLPQSSGIVPDLPFINYVEMRTRWRMTFQQAAQIYPDAKALESRMLAGMNQAAGVTA